MLRLLKETRDVLLIGAVGAHHQQAGLRIDHDAVALLAPDDHCHDFTDFAPEVDIAAGGYLAGIEGGHRAVAGAAAVIAVTALTLVTDHLTGADPGIGYPDTLQVEVVEVVAAGNRPIRQDLVAVAAAAEVIAITVPHSRQHFFQGDPAQAEGDVAGDVRVHHQVLPGAFHQAEEELAGRHVLGRDIEARATADTQRTAQWRDQRGLHRSWRHDLVRCLGLLQAFIEQLAALLIELLVAINEGLAGAQQAGQAQQAETRQDCVHRLHRLGFNTGSARRSNCCWP